MEKETVIRQLIHNSSQRANRELGACLLMVLIFGNRLLHLSTGSVHYAGCLLLVITAVFIGGVVWRFKLDEELLRYHPANDSTFWRDTFLSQARLLRLVPYWYLAPLTTGIILYAFPASARNLGSFYGYLVVVVLLFAGIASLNKLAAAKLDEQARALGL